MCSLEFRPPLVRPIARGRAPLCLETCRCAVRLQMSAVHHERVAVPARLGQVAEDAGKDPEAGPAHKAIVERLVRPIHDRRILPAQAVAQDKEDPTQHPPVIHPRLASGLGKMRPQPFDLPIRQPEPTAHATLRSRAA